MIYFKLVSLLSVPDLFLCLLPPHITVSATVFGQQLFLGKHHTYSNLLQASPLLVTERGMAQPVHLQYNSPMPIYSK